MGNDLLTIKPSEKGSRPSSTDEEEDRSSINKEFKQQLFSNSNINEEEIKTSEEPTEKTENVDVEFIMKEPKKKKRSSNSVGLMFKFDSDLSIPSSIETIEYVSPCSDSEDNGEKNMFISEDEDEENVLFEKLKNSIGEDVFFVDENLTILEISIFIRNINQIQVKDQPKLVHFKKNTIGELKKNFEGFKLFLLDIVDKDMNYWCPVELESLKKNYLVFRSVLKSLKDINVYKNLKPIDYVSYTKLGFIHFFKSSFKISKELCMKSIELFPNNALPYHCVASIISLTTKDYPKAIEYYQKSIKINPKFEYPYLGLGNVYFHLRNYKSAIKYYESAVSINGDLYSFFNLGKAHYHMKNFTKTVEYYEKALNINPQNDVVLFDLGNVHLDLKNYSLALRCFKNAVKIGKQKEICVISHINIGFVYLQMEQYEESTKYYEKSIQMNPQYESAFNGLGIAMVHLKKYLKAEECFQKVIELNPKSLDALKNLSDLYKKKKDSQKSKEYSKKLKELKKKK